MTACMAVHDRVRERSSFFFFFFPSLLLSSSTRRFCPQLPSGQDVVTGVVPSPPLRAFNFYRA